MKAYLYRAQLLSRTTNQTGIVTGEAYRLGVPPSSRVPEHQLELQPYIECQLVSANGAINFGVRVRLETSLDGVDWVESMILKNLNAEGSFAGLETVDLSILSYVRVVVVPYSGNGNLPIWKGNISLVGDGPFKATLVR